MSAIMRKGSRCHYIAWLAPNAFAISWEIDKTAMGSRLRFPIRRRSVTDRKGAERFTAKWGLRSQSVVGNVGRRGWASPLEALREVPGHL